MTSFEKKTFGQTAIFQKKHSLKKAKRISYDTQIILTTFSKINQIQNIIESSIKLLYTQEAE
jgi:hypothetical protein